MDKTNSGPLFGHRDAPVTRDYGDVKGFMQREGDENTEVTHLPAPQDKNVDTSPQTRENCCTKAIKWTLTIAAVAGLAAGVIGLLVYLGTLQLGLANVGTMSAATGLYTSLAGFGVTFISAVLTGVMLCSQRKTAGSVEELGDQGNNKTSSWQAAKAKLHNVQVRVGSWFSSNTATTV